jgi:hypothetical protein
MRRLVAALAVAFAAAAIVSCGGGGSSGKGPKGGAGGGGGIAIGGAGGAVGAGGAGCSTIENVGQTVTQVETTGIPPTPMGGTIADGTYVLIRHEDYPPVTVDAPAHSTETLQIAGTQMAAAITSDAYPAGLQALATLAMSGTDLTMTWVCGASGTFDLQYTATATDLLLITPPGDVQAYTKQ